MGALQQKYPQIMCACLYIKVRLQGIRYTQGYVHCSILQYILQYTTINLFNCETKDGEACELEVNHCKGICSSILPKSFHFHAAYSVKGRQIKEIIGMTSNRGSCCNHISELQARSPSGCHYRNSTPCSNPETLPSWQFLPMHCLVSVHVFEAGMPT